MSVLKSLLILLVFLASNIVAEFVEESHVDWDDKRAREHHLSRYIHRISRDKRRYESISSREKCGRKSDAKRRATEEIPLQPLPSEEQPLAAEEQQPAAEEQQPATEQKPPAEQQPPATGVQPLAEEQPLAEGQPSEDQRLPATGGHEPPANMTVPSSPVRIPMYTGKHFGVGLYFVDMDIGTPPQKVKLIVDTGSDLTWVNCTFNEETQKALKQADNDQVRRFKAENSSSFKTITCNSTMCSQILSNSFALSCCPNPSSPCMYNYSYLDGTTAEGIFGKEVLTLPLMDGSTVTLKNVVGCTEAFRKKAPHGGDGVLGLGGYYQSFGMRAAARLGYGRFSYCLVDFNSHSDVAGYLMVGGDRSTTGKIVGKMRYGKLNLKSSSYAVDVRGISFDNNTMLPIPLDALDGGAIVDVGASLTFLTPPAYKQVMDVLINAIAPHVQRVHIKSVMDFCFNSTGFHESMVPRLEFHFDGGEFAGGGRFKPHVKGYITDLLPGVKCIAILEGNNESGNMIGNIMQQNYFWEFNIFSEYVGFAASTCRS